MLFPLDPNTPRCKVFEKLNEELLFFLRKSINAQQFNRQLFSRFMGEECWDNISTKEKFQTVFDQLPISLVDRQALFNSINNCQNLSLLFDNKTAVIPRIAPIELFDAIKSLTTHLFTRTKDLAGVKRTATESIEQHYQSYVQANSELCFFCGTACLSQNRMNLADDDQWRSDYDHLLCKDKYPAFSCHPDNFVPTCHICNSKAKGAIDILADAQSHRRKAFYPLPPKLQSFYHLVTVNPVFSELDSYAEDGNSNPLKSIPFKYDAATPDEREMIKAWISVYQVPQRVGERLVSTFCEYIDADCTPERFEDFCDQVARKARGEPRDMRKTEWRFWWFRLYQWLNVQTEDVKRNAWELIQWKQQQVNNNNDAEQTYGI